MSVSPDGEYDIDGCDIGFNVYVFKVGRHSEYLRAGYGIHDDALGCDRVLDLGLKA